MNFGYCEACLDHDTGPRHPESPDRLRAIRQALADSHSVEYVSPPPATEADLTSVHAESYVEEVRDFCGNGGGDWDSDTVAVEATWEAARASAGLAMWAARAALDGEDGRDTPFSIGRPPGHHAVADDAMGFCFFNNAAVAAEHAIDGGDADRVAIFDWDVHHGNGTQEVFYDRGDVFYGSVHETGLYPGTGTVEETGTGPGAGTTLNVPFPPGTGTPGYLAAIDECFLPAIEAFDPDLVLISAGFDGHEHDPISRLRLSTDGYALMADRYREFAGRTDTALGFVLEGGYGLETLSESVRTINEVFDGYTPVEPEGTTEPGSREVIDRVKALDVAFA